jgi:protein O-GlcNAc transferase
MLSALLRGFTARVRRKDGAPPEHRLPLPEQDVGRASAAEAELLRAGLEAYHGGQFAAARRRIELLCESEHIGALALAILGMIQQTTGDEAAARDAYARARERDPMLLRRVVDAAKLARARKGGDREALGGCLMAAGLAPENAALQAQAGDLYYLTGHPEQAQRWMARAYRASGRDALRVKEVYMRLPPILRSAEHVANAHAAYLAGLEELAAARLEIADPAKEINVTNFYLAFEGFNERDSQGLLAQILLKASPMLGYVAPHCAAPRPQRGRLRIGFVSRYLKHGHSVGVAYARMVQALAERPDFDVSIVTPGESLPPDLAGAQRALGERAFDLVVHTDIGMDPFTSFLAYGRYAPVQAALGGHPLTTGIPNVDAYISSALLEHPEAQAHYTERLVLLPELPCAMAPPPQLPPLPREDLGLDRRRRLYVCPMKLQKLHPDFDSALRAILDADPRADILFFEERATPAWNSALHERLRHALGEHFGRVIFEPWAEFPRFLRILQTADVVLDSFHFGAGTTAFLALGSGCPIVTLPAQYQRGRSTLSAYNRIGISECIARDPAEYTRIAVRVASDKTYQADLRARIRAASPALFDHEGPAAALAAALERLYAEWQQDRIG